MPISLNSSHLLPTTNILFPFCKSSQPKGRGAGRGWRTRSLLPYSLPDPYMDLMSKVYFCVSNLFCRILSRTFRIYYIGESSVVQARFHFHHHKARACQREISYKSRELALGEAGGQAYN